MESRKVTDVVHIPCPSCDKLCKREGTAAGANHSTLDCEHCGILLVIKDGRVYPFHEWSGCTSRPHVGQLTALAQPTSRCSVDEAQQRDHYQVEINRYYTMLTMGLQELKNYPSPVDSTDLLQLECIVRRISYATHELHITVGQLYGMERGRFPLQPF